MVSLSRIAVRFPWGKIVGRDMDFPEDLGIIIEAPGFLGHFSGYENLKLLAMIRHRIGKKKFTMQWSS